MLPVLLRYLFFFITINTAIIPTLTPPIADNTTIKTTELSFFWTSVEFPLAEDSVCVGSSVSPDSNCSSSRCSFSPQLAQTRSERPGAFLVGAFTSTQSLKLWPAAGISSCATKTVRHIEQCLPSVSPLSVQVAGFWASTTSV